MRVNLITNYLNNQYVNRNYQKNKSVSNQSYLNKPFVSVSFGKKSFMENDPQTIISKINSTISKKDSILGSGCEGVVYSIPDTGYCVKVPYECDVSKLKVSPRCIKTNVGVKDKINHIVAKLKDGAVVMEELDGVPIWTPNMEKSVAQKNSEIVADLPESSYRDFLEQIAFARKNDMIFDSFNYNVILDPKDKKLNAIDFIYNSKMNIFYEMYPLQSMFTSLINPETTLEQKRMIAKKILNVSLDELKSGKNLDISSNEFDFCEFAEYLDKNGILKLDQKFFEMIDKITYYKDLELLKNIHKPTLNTWIRQTKKMIK